MNRLLVLARHGQSEWNLKNLFTGWKDPGLTDLGIEEARNAGRRLKEMGVQFDVAFTSDLGRAQRTCKLILEEIGQPDLKTIADQALNERDYGDLSGLNKDDARARWGEGDGRHGINVAPAISQRHHRPRAGDLDLETRNVLQHRDGRDKPCHDV